MDGTEILCTAVFSLVLFIVISLVVISIARRRMDIILNGKRFAYVGKGMYMCPVCKGLIPGKLIRPGAVVKRFKCDCFRENDNAKKT
jgi:hypothetical protein